MNKEEQCQQSHYGSNESQGENYIPWKIHISVIEVHKAPDNEPKYNVASKVEGQCRHMYDVCYGTLAAGHVE